MTRTNAKFLLKLLDKMIAHVRKEFTHKDSQILVKLQAVRDEFIKVYGDEP